MSLAWAVFVVVVFAATVERLKLPERAREVTSRARDCLRVLRDPSMDDDAKQRALQRHALRLFVLLGVLLGGSVLGLLLPLGGIWVLERWNLASLSHVVGVLQRLDFLLVTVVVGIIAYFIARATGVT